MKKQSLKKYYDKDDRVNSYLISESFARNKVMTILNSADMSPEEKKSVYDQIDNLSKSLPFGDGEKLIDVNDLLIVLDKVKIN